MHGYTYARPGGVLLLYSLRSPAEGATTADRQTVAALFFPKPRKDRHFARKSRRVATLCVPEDLEPLLFLTKSTHCCSLYSFSPVRALYRFPRPRRRFSIFSLLRICLSCGEPGPGSADPTRQGRFSKHENLTEPSIQRMYLSSQFHLAGKIFKA